MYETFKSGTSFFKSSSLPARILTNVVLPVPFSPNKTTISEFLKPPPSISNSKVTYDGFFGFLYCFFKLGYLKWEYLSDLCSESYWEILKLNSYSLNLIFSVGIKPAKKTLIPSLTEKGIVTIP